MDSSPESRRIENILASISDSFYALDAQFRFIYINPQAEAYFGRSRDELLGYDIREVFPQIRDSVFVREFTRVLEGGGKSNFVAQSRVTGRWVDMTIYAQPKDVALPDGGGGLAVYFRDVTETRESREALLLSEERLRMVSDANSIALWAWDYAKDRLFYQHGLDQLFGFHIDSFGEILPYMHPDELKPLEALISGAVGRREGYEAEFRIKRDIAREADPQNPKDWRWIITKVSVRIGEQGEILLLGLNRDVTERKTTQLALEDSQQQLDLIVEKSDMAVWRWQPSKDEIVYQKNLESFFITSQVHNKDAIDLIHPDDAPGIAEITRKAIEGELPIETQFRLARVENADPVNEADWRWVENKSSPVGTGANLQFLGYIVDVTKRKTEEQTYQATQERLQTVALDAGFSFFVWDHQRDVITEKFMLDEFYGYSIDSFAQAESFMHPDDVNKIKTALESVALSDGRNDIEFRMVRVGIANPDPNNTAHWRHILCKLSRQSNSGEPAVLYAFNYDLTAQKEVEGQLRAAQNQMERISKEAGVAMWVWEPERDILHSKFLLDETYGFEVTGWDSAAKNYHPDDVAPTSAMIERVIKTHQSDEVEHRIRRFENANPTKVEDWKTFLIKVSAGLTPEGYTVLYGFNIDVSQYRIEQENVRRSELRFRSLVQASVTSVWRATAEGYILPDATDTHDNTNISLQGLDRLAWLERVHPDDRENARIVWENALATHSDYQVDYRLNGPQGYRWMRARGVPVIGADGSIIEWVGTLDDINDAKIADELREQLLNQEREARMVAEAASRAKDEFLAVVSHELRTPLNAILGWSHLIRTGDLPMEVAKNGLEVIERNARSQAQIVEDILDVARIVTGKLAIDLKPLDLQDVAREALESVTAIGAQKGVRLHSQLESVSILGDATRIRQIFWNLLNNAIKFTPEGGDVYLIISRHKDRAKVFVSDSGMGIAPEFLPHVFDRFRQADSSSTRRHGGLGLGLALVRSLVESHNGKVNARSEGIGSGSTFEVDLPLSEKEGEQSIVETPTQARKRLADTRILVVDDAQDTLELISLILKREGAVTNAALSVSDARKAMQRGQFDVVLSDLAMPDEDGYKLLSWSKAHHEDLPVIAMTAFAGTIEKDRAVAAGFDGFIGKPIESEKLITSIINLVSAVAS